MKTLLLAFAFVVTLGAQVTTTVTDTLRDARARTVSGQIQLEWDAFTTAAGVFIPAGRSFVPVVKGVFSVALYPNDTATPPTGNYTATYAIQRYKRNAETWHVCSSFTPLALSAVTGVVVCGGQIVGAPSWATTTSITWGAMTSATWATLQH